MQSIPGSVAVGALACQMNSFLQKRVSRVLYCAKQELAPPTAAAAKSKAASSSSEPQKELYEVVLDDSVLFPEGGGQPCDLGTIGPATVQNVLRRGNTCVVVTDRPLTVGDEYSVEVDWERRVDHMQHHSAQHLLTAIVEKQLGLPTMSWSLTHPYCFIQVPAASVTEAQLREVERECNELIRRSVLVERQVFATKEEVPPSRSRGIPADVTGPIRLIEIPDVDTCTCCGTHVENLSQLHVIKMLHQEPKANTCRLFFVTGDRLLRSFGELYELQRGLVKEMGTHTANLLPSVVRRGQELAAQTKHNTKLLAELSKLVAQDTASQARTFFSAQQQQQQEDSKGRAVPFLYFREDVNIDFVGEVAEACLKEIALLSTSAAAVPMTAVLGCGVGTEGQFMVIGSGTKETLTPTFEQVCQLLEGKGGYSKNKFRGKGNMKKWKELAKFQGW